MDLRESEEIASMGIRERRMQRRDYRESRKKGERERGERGERGEREERVARVESKRVKRIGESKRAERAEREGEKRERGNLSGVDSPVKRAAPGRILKFQPRGALISAGIEPVPEGPGGKPGGSLWRHWDRGCA